jgi:hypothetical protein
VPSRIRYAPPCLPRPQPPERGVACTDAPSKLQHITVTVDGVPRREPTVVDGNLLDLKITGAIPDAGMTLCIDTTGARAARAGGGRRGAAPRAGGLGREAPFEAVAQT